MNNAHFHLLVNHLPIIFPVAGIIVMILGWIIKSEAVKRTAYFIFILAALGTVVAMQSGESAENSIEKLNGVSKDFIETHEDAAKTFAILAYTLGAVSLIGLWASWKKKVISNIISISVLVFALVLMVFAKQVGTTGGKIIHTEIRNNQLAGGAANDD